MYFKYVFQLLVFQLLHNTAGSTIIEAFGARCADIRLQGEPLQRGC